MNPSREPGPQARLEYGLIGRALKHSFSPQIHRQLGRYEYGLYPMEPEQVAPFLERGEFKGLNVTIPYKKVVMEHCHALSPAARRIGCVNTIVRRENGTLYGHNTDYDGLLYTFTRAGMELAGKKVLILGSGGASLTVQMVARDLGAAQVVVVSRKGEDNYETLSRHHDSQMIINATPVGMYPNTGVSLVELEGFYRCEGVCDLVYNPARTKLMLDAERLGIPAVGGLGMLVAQAKAAAELFQGRRLSSRLMEEILTRLEFQTRNVVVIGMPGSGKTTIGREVARRLGRSFMDIDTLIVREAGVSIPEIFAAQGESGFRRLETRVMERVCKENGLVIATGGGCVTVPENHDLIRQNGIVVYLQRALGELATEGRPLSLTVPLTELFAQRKPLYEKLAEFTVENRRIQQAAEDIARGVVP